MPKLYLMCGIPASGKSTIANKIATEENAAIISFDEIRATISQGKPYTAKQNEQTFKLLDSTVKDAFNAKEDIVLDSIHGKSSERKQYAARAKKHGYQTICVFCQKSYIYAINANQMRVKSKRVPEKIIRINHNFFVPPAKAEGWDEIRIMDGNKYSVEVEDQHLLDEFMLERTTCKPIKS